jgi:hypothetical protein
MRRIIALLSVMAVMGAMMVAMAMPSFAQAGEKAGCVGQALSMAATTTPPGTVGSKVSEATATFTPGSVGQAV